MTDDIEKTSAQRQALVAEARSWIGTPYERQVALKGVGCDCVTLLAEVAISQGRLERAELEAVGFYSDDWFHNASTERYLVALRKVSRLVLSGRCIVTLQPNPGDFAVIITGNSKKFNHGGIVTRWPMVIHAGGHGTKVRETNAALDPMWEHMAVEFYDLFGDK